MTPDTRDRLVTDPPLTADEIRRRIDKHDCCQYCCGRGWAVEWKVEDGEVVPRRLAVCDCIDGAGVFDDDIALLPEAVKTLADAVRVHRIRMERLGL